jgi:hypothetical protein
VVKGFNAMQKKEPEKPKDPTTEEKLLTEIRDLLKARAAADGAIASGVAPSQPPPV